MRLSRPRNPWRRRAWKTALWIALVLIAVFALSRTVQGSAGQGYEEVTVGQGDTVWSIASDRYPGSDTRTKVDEILRANGLKESVVYPGEKLKVPVE